MILGAAPQAPIAGADAFTLREQFHAAEFIGVVRVSEREHFTAASNPTAEFERVQLEVVQAWHGAELSEVPVCYPVHRMGAIRALSSEQTHVVFLSRGSSEDWQLLGEPLQASQPTDQVLLHLALREACSTWQELQELAPEKQRKAEYRWLQSMFAEPLLRSQIAAEFSGRQRGFRWQQGAFATEASAEHAATWLTAWPEVSIYDQQACTLLSVLRQSDPSAAAGWILGQLDAGWQSAERADWYQLLATFSQLSMDARYPAADRAEQALHAFLDVWLAPATDVAPVDAKPGADAEALQAAYRQLRSELLAWMAEADTAHATPW